MLPTLQQLECAAKLVHRVLPPTPQYRWPQLCQQIGAEVWVKHENHLPLGAFKIRGGLVYLHELMEREPETSGVIAATRGNHGQSIAFAARQVGIRAVIVVPHGNSREKNAAMRALGADLVEYGEDFSESVVHARELSRTQGLHLVPSFHDALVRGVASYALELFGAVSDLARIYVPIGMGSGICGVIAAHEALGLRTEIVGVVAEGAGAAALAAMIQDTASRGVQQAVILSGGNVDREIFADVLGSESRVAS